MTLSRRTLSFLTNTLSIAILIGCHNPVGKSAHGKGTPPHGNGGGVVDGGGGGDFIYHSKEEVIKAIDEVWNQLIQKHPDNPILQLSWFTNKEHVEGNREQQEAFQILNRILSAGPPGFEKSKNVVKDTEYVTARYPKLELNGMCRGPHDQSYLASVNHLDRSGTICISVYGLMRTPSGALYSDLFGLFIHEIAHLNGYGEDEARAIQRFMLKNIFRVLFLASDEARVHFLNKYWDDVTSQWPVLINYGPIDETYLRQLSYSANFILDYNIPQHVKRGAARNDLADDVRNALAHLSDNLSIFGEEMYGHFLKSETSINQLQLSRMRSLAVELMALDKLITSYLVGSDPALLNRLISTRRLKREAVLVNKLADADWITSEAKPQTLCSEEQMPLNLESLSLSEKFRYLGVRQRKVCEREFRRLWPDLYKLGTDNSEADKDDPVPTEGAKQDP